MKFHNKFFLSFLFFFLLLSSTKDSLQKKILRHDNFTIECFVSLKNKKAKSNIKTYYWFKSGKVHHSQGEVGGYVLHDKFFKFYRNKQLAEQGYYNYGVKDGLWRIWFENGFIKEHINWKNGLKNGNYLLNDSLGNLIIKGKFKNNLKSGKWINYKKNDTIIYKNDVIVVKKENGESIFKRIFKSKKNEEKKPSFFKRLFSKKERKKDSLNNIKKQKKK